MPISSNIAPEDGFRFDDIDELLLYAHLATDSYAGAGANANMTVPLPPAGWRVLLATGSGEPVPTFQATAYTNGTQVVVAYRGTDDGPETNFGPGELLYSSVPLGLGAPETWVTADSVNITNVPVRSTSYLQAAYNFYRAVADATGGAIDRISFTGHSLGGIVAGVMSEIVDRPAIVFASGPHVDAVERLVPRLDLNGDGLADGATFDGNFDLLYNTRVTGEILGSAVFVANGISSAIRDIAAWYDTQMAAELAQVRGIVGGSSLGELNGGADLKPFGIDIETRTALHKMQLHMLLLYADKKLGLKEYKDLPGFLSSFYDAGFAAKVANRYDKYDGKTTMFSDIVLSLMGGGEDVLTPLLNAAELLADAPPSVAGLLDAGDMSRFENVASEALSDWVSGDTSVQRDDLGEKREDAFAKVAAELLIEYAVRARFDSGRSFSADVLSTENGISIDIAAIRAVNGKATLAGTTDLLSVIKAGLKVATQDGGDAGDSFDWLSGFTSSVQRLILGGAGTFVTSLDKAGIVIGAAGSGTQVTGSGAADLVIGGNRIQSDGDSGKDVFDGGAGADIFFGLSGRDTIIGRIDGDRIFGGDDRDHWTFAGATHGVVLDMGGARIAARGMVGGGAEAIGYDLEEFTGSAFADSFDINAMPEGVRFTVRGGGGADTFRIAAGVRQVELLGDADDRLYFGGTLLTGRTFTQAHQGARYKFGAFELSDQHDGSFILWTGAVPVAVLDNFVDGSFGIDLVPFQPEAKPEEDDRVADARGDYNRAGQPLVDPLVVDVDGDGVELVAPDAGFVLFDIDADGELERVGWVAPDDGFLAIDANGNGRIDGVSELFGDANQLGFAELATLNSYEDYMGLHPVIDAHDADFARLVVWRDLDQDGVSGSGELFSLQSLGITSISLGTTPVGQTLAGNLVIEQAPWSGRNGNTGGQISEVFLGYAELGDPRAMGPNAGPASGAWSLPDSRGYGTLASWSRAGASNAGFKAALEALATLPIDRIDEARGLTETMLFAWAGASTLSPMARGTAFDARRLAVLEAVFGQPFVDANGTSAPNTRTAVFLEQAWDTLVELFQERALVQGALHSLFPNATYDFASDRLVLGDSWQAILGRIGAVPADERLALVLAIEPVLTAHEADLDMYPGQAMLETARLNAGYDSEDALFARYLAAYAGERHSITYSVDFDPEMGTYHVYIQPLWLSGPQAVIGTGYGDEIYFDADDPAKFSLVYAGAGNDLININSAGYYFGGDGDDNVFNGGFFNWDGQYGNIYIYAGVGKDSVGLINASNSFIYLGDGDDSAGIYVSQTSVSMYHADNNIVFGGAGNDQFDSYGENNVFLGEAGNDRFLLRFGTTFGMRVTADGGAGDDRFEVDINSEGFLFSTLMGGSGQDSYIGPIRHSRLDMGGDDDVVDALIGDYDTSEGTRIFGGEGNDVITVSPDPVSYSYPGPRYSSFQASPMIEPGAGDDVVTVNNALGGQWPLIVLGSVGNDRIVVNSEITYRVVPIARDRDTLVLASGAPLTIDLNGLTGISSFSQIGQQWVTGQVTLLLPSGQRIILQRAGMTDLSGITIKLNEHIGTSRADRLIGDSDAELLDGRGGVDEMRGGGGNDRYIADEREDVIVEFEGGGIDTVESRLDYVLPAWVENLILTGGGSNGTGNTLANRITGNIYDNTLLGGDGDDRLDGLAGGDTLRGGRGNDVFVVDDFGDKVIENNGEGNDTVEAWVSFSLAGQYVETLKLLGNAAADGTGNSLANLLIGNAIANRLDGGAGADEMRGGKGEDIYFVDNAGDRVIELDGEGSDLVNSSVTFSLAGQFIEVLNLTGSASINGTGNGLANRLVGNSAANVLYGMDGNDRLDGGAGVDRMRGGLGNDVFVVDNAGDVVEENDGEGSDTVETSISYSLVGRFVEQLVLTGNANINGTGNGLTNTIIGNSGNNLLNGMGGADSMRGGAGDDRYIVDNVGDAVVEANGAGYDVLEASVTFSLAGQYAEALTLTGAANINGTGNSLANALTGNSGKNLLRGESGNDVLKGGLGADTLLGGVGLDQFWFDTALGASNIDTIGDFNVADDTLYLDRTIFGAIAANGTLATGAFRAGKAALDADDRILYDAATGNLWYDRDGAGGAAAVQFAKLSAGLALTADDFVSVP